MQRFAVKREFEAWLRHALTVKLSLSTQQLIGTFVELGKNKAAKGEGWAPPFISCAQDIVGLPPTTPTAIRLWETFTFTFLWQGQLQNVVFYMGNELIMDFSEAFKDLVYEIT